MAILLLFFALSIAVSFFCSILEAVVLSITPSYIRKQKESNPKLYQNLNEFKQDIDRPLSAILTLNTIAHTVGAVGVGAQAAIVFGRTEINVFGFNIAAESIVAGVMTLSILVLSEIIPKTVGANYWKRLTPLTVKLLRGLIIILLPFVWLSQLITKRLKNDKDRSVLSRADLMALTLATNQDGSLSRKETNVIQNVLNLPKMKIYDIMTPRSVLFAVSEDQTVGELTKNERFQQFSRIPVFARDKEEVVGVVLKNDVLWELVKNNKDVQVKKLLRPINTVNEDALLVDFFHTNHSKKAHMFIVVDGYGSITGVVTLEDVLETILGYEIIDETDKVTNMQELASRDKKKEDDK